MRKAHVDRNGAPRCRKCGSTKFLAKVTEKSARTKHLKCVECGTRQKYCEAMPTA